MKLKELIAIIKELDDVRTPLKDALIEFTERIILRNNLESLTDLYKDGLITDAKFKKESKRIRQLLNERDVW